MLNHIVVARAPQAKAHAIDGKAHEHVIDGKAHEHVIDGKAHEYPQGLRIK